ncbi:undecaprenyl-diphosphate phosphatase [Halorientalis marina]|uniref:undecaprenyl-diphosphate phosphatase n=1 Tax=Halorientalis marina TaxID=2931976 RepID=UPI001FF51E79|nr:undecaprenyl-diphosphate phosphatase [Halorientalis marina]
MDPRVVAVLVGIVQGVLEWLPVSSEGSVALLLTLVGNASPEVAVQYALFLHAGTAVAATTYYRDDVWALLRKLPRWRPAGAFDADRAEFTFLATATLSSALVGAVAYTLLEDLASELAGGAFVALIGALLIVTGVVQRVASDRGAEATATADESRPDGGADADGDPSAQRPTLLDALLVGGLQGLAILPGVSRSGTTVSALLLRGHAGVDALRLSFLLSIPAAAGAGVLVLADTGLPGIDPTAALLALATSAVVGFLTVDALVRLVRRVAFWGVCVGFGALAVVGGALLLV